MADAISTQVLFSGKNRHVVKITNISDGTGEANVVKIDKSTLIGPDGVEPSSMTIERMVWAIEGMSVKVAWDHTTDDTAAVLSGHSEEYYQMSGGLSDPQSAGGTGDLVITTIGQAANDTYDITIDIRLKE